MYECRDSSSQVYNGSKAIAGLFGNVRIDFTYNNIGADPALGGQIMFDLPDGYSFLRANEITTNQEVIQCFTNFE